MHNGKENKEMNLKKGFLGITPVLFVIIVTSLVAINTSVKQDSFAQEHSMDNLTSSNVSIPVSTGFIDGKIAYFIATDASTQEVASSVSNTTGFKVNYAPSLANTSESSSLMAFLERKEDLWVHSCQLQQQFQAILIIAPSLTLTMCIGIRIIPVISES